MFSTDFIIRQQEKIVDNQKCKAGFRPLCNKVLSFEEGATFIQEAMSSLDTGVYSRRVNLHPLF